MFDFTLEELEVAERTITEARVLEAELWNAIASTDMHDEWFRAVNDTAASMDIDLERGMFSGLMSKFRAYPQWNYYDSATLHYVRDSPLPDGLWIVIRGCSNSDGEPVEYQFPAEFLNENTRHVALKWLNKTMKEQRAAIIKAKSEVVARKVDNLDQQIQSLQKQRTQMMLGINEGDSSVGS